MAPNNFSIRSIFERQAIIGTDEIQTSPLGEKMNHGTSVEPKAKDLRDFSLIWSAIFFFIAIFPLFGGGDIRMIPLGVCGIFLVIAIARPSILVGFYKLWIKFGDFMGGIISRVILSVLFFGMFTPIAFFLKFAGKDLLKKKLDKDGTSYWIKRESQPGSLKNQF